MKITKEKITDLILEEIKAVLVDGERINEATRLNTRYARDLFKVRREIDRAVQGNSGMFPEDIQTIMDLCDQIKEAAGQVRTHKMSTGSD